MATCVYPQQYQVKEERSRRIKQCWIKELHKQKHVVLNVHHHYGIIVVGSLSKVT